MSVDPLDFFSFALLILLAYKERQWELREKAWALERAALLTRIQHPEVFQPPAVEVPRETPAEILEPETDEIDLVGTVVDGNGDGN